MKEKGNKFKNQNLQNNEDNDKLFNVFLLEFFKEST